MSIINLIVAYKRNRSDTESHFAFDYMVMEYFYVFVVVFLKDLSIPPSLPFLVLHMKIMKVCIVATDITISYTAAVIASKRRK